MVAKSDVQRGVIITKSIIFIIHRMEVTEKCTYLKMLNGQKTLPA